MRALVLDKGSWKKHIMLDKLTGLDPPGVKLRAAQGFGESYYLSHCFLNWIVVWVIRFKSAGIKQHWDPFHNSYLIP